MFDGISKKFIPNLSIDEEISYWGNITVLFIMREDSLIADIIHYELTWIIHGF